eukprot:c16714_g1_i1 orf=411-725(+)
MSRLVTLGLVLLVLIVTSQSEWRPQFGNVVELTSAALKQQQVMNRRDFIKEQIILSQEQKIYGLSELVKILQHKLGQCQEIAAQNMRESAAVPQVEIVKLEEDF